MFGKCKRLSLCTIHTYVQYVHSALEFVMGRAPAIAAPESDATTKFPLTSFQIGKESRPVWNRSFLMEIYHFDML